MPARLLDGRKTAAEIRDELKREVARLAQRGIIPGLAGILVGDDPGSVSYIGLKSKACEEIGIREMMRRLPASISESELLEQIDRLNRDEAVHGVFIQLPLPGHLAEERALAAVSPDKDVDGFHAMNVGKAWLGQPAFVPAVAIAIQEIITRNGYSFEGKSVVIVNVDNMVGKPLASVLVQDRPGARANVTLCHPSTPDLERYTRQADFLVLSVNRPRFVNADMIKEGAILIDFGGAYVDDPVMKRRKTVGDVDAESVRDKAAALTPVPGGVGPMLVTMLMKNTIEAAKRAAAGIK